MIDDAKESGTDLPQTGDDSDAALWVAIIMIAVGVFLAGAALYGRKMRFDRWLLAMRPVVALFEKRDTCPYLIFLHEEGAFAHDSACPFFAHSYTVICDS